MKKVNVIIIICLIFLEMQAKQKSLKSSETNTNQNWKSFQKSNQQSAKQLAQNKAALSLNTNDDVELISTTSDELGFEHYRFQQTYKGIPVEGAIYLMHEKKTAVILSNGKLVHKLNINTTPTLSEAEARQFAIHHVPAKLFAWEITDHKASSKQNLSTSQHLPKGTLTILDPQFTQKSGNYRLAFRYTINAIQPIIQQDVYVDAHTGTILMAIDNIHSCTETTLQANTNYSGRVDVSVCAEDGATTHLISTQYGGLEVRDFESNNLIAINDSLATEVLWATEKTFDYFSSHHNRNITDSTTVSKMNYSDNCLGAFYLSQEAAVMYCAGNGTTHNAYTTPDIVGHELTHGVNKFSSNLINRYESGALNESFADIFGELVEAHCFGNADWITGAKVSPANKGLRNLAQPKDENMKTQQPHTYLGENWVVPSSICIRNNDYCGVHRNSGVQNYWFYLLAEGGTGVNDNGFPYDISGIEKEKAAEIAYRNLNTYLTSTSTYIDARQGSIQAATDLFGAGSFEVSQTRKAWKAVGVTHNPTEIKSANETVLADGTFQFYLLADSLNQAINANGLIIYVDVSNNFDITSIELMYPDLMAAEFELNDRTISINRMHSTLLNTNEPLFKVTATLQTHASENTMVINGGTLTNDAGFIPFKEVAIEMPNQTCGNDPVTSQNTLPLITEINYETCTTPSSVIVKILEDTNAPFAHIWIDKADSIKYQHVGYEQSIEVSNLSAGKYQVTISDTQGRCTSLEVIIPLLSNRDGNNFCGNRCPDYLVTPDGKLRGTYNAREALEVKGFVGSSHSASFNICN